jgi:hypothetical protein
MSQDGFFPRRIPIKGINGDVPVFGGIALKVPLEGTCGAFILDPLVNKSPRKLSLG